MTTLYWFAFGWVTGVVSLMQVEVVWSLHRQSRRPGPPREWVDE